MGMGICFSDFGDIPTIVSILYLADNMREEIPKSSLRNISLPSTFCTHCFEISDSTYSNLRYSSAEKNL